MTASTMTRLSVRPPSSTLERTSAGSADRLRATVTFLATRNSQPATPSRRQSSLPPTQRLHPVLRHDERVLDPDADLSVGEVEAGLDGDDVSDLDLVVIRRHEAERRFLVDLQADAVAEGVDVAVERGRIAARGAVAMRLEEVAHHGLIDLR